LYLLPAGNVDAAGLEQPDTAKKTNKTTKSNEARFAFFISLSFQICL